MKTHITSNFSINIISCLALLLITANLFIIFTPTLYEQAYSYLASINGGKITQNDLAYALSLAPYDIDLWSLTGHKTKLIYHELQALPSGLTQPLKKVNVINITTIIICFFIWRNATSEKNTPNPNNAQQLTDILSNISEKNKKSYFIGSKKLSYLTYSFTALIILHCINLVSDLYNLYGSSVNIEITNFLAKYDLHPAKQNKTSYIAVLNIIIVILQYFYIAIIFLYTATKTQYKKQISTALILIAMALSLYYLFQLNWNISSAIIYINAHKITIILLVITYAIFLYMHKSNIRSHYKAHTSFGLFTSLILFSLFLMLSPKSDIIGGIIINLNIAYLAFLTGSHQSKRKSKHYLNAINRK